MIIYYSYFICIAIAPLEDDSPLFINTYAMEIFQVAAKFFKPVGGRNSEILYVL